MVEKQKLGHEKTNIQEEANLPKRKASRNGKYNLIVWLLEKGFTVEQIRELTPKAALEMFPSDNDELMEHLRKYVKQNKSRIRTANLFFPGQKGQPMSERGLLHELHFHLREHGRTLDEFGLRIRQEKKKKEPEKPADVLAWAKELLLEE